MKIKVYFRKNPTSRWKLFQALDNLGDLLPLIEKILKAHGEGLLLGVAELRIRFEE